MNMKVLVTGVKGQLGYDVIECLKGQNIECLGVDKDDFDLTNEDSTNEYIKKYLPSVVVHCAAYTAVDKAEDDKEICHSVNVLGTSYIAKACKDIGAKMVYISTDYVFDGNGEQAFEVDSNPSPINYYGLTKYQGEEEVLKALEKYFIVRISWVFGANGNNFIKTMLKLGKDRKNLSVINDQVGSPTYTYDLAKLICEMIKTEKYGVYHATNEGYCSWYEFACKIFEFVGIHDVKVAPITTEEYPTRAIRPRNSRLSKTSLDKAGFDRLPNWEDAVKRYVEEIVVSD